MSVLLLLLLLCVLQVGHLAAGRQVNRRQCTGPGLPTQHGHAAYLFNPCSLILYNQLTSSSAALVMAAPPQALIPPPSPQPPIPAQQTLTPHPSPTPNPPAAPKGSIVLQPILEPHNLIPAGQEDQHGTHDERPLCSCCSGGSRPLLGRLLERALLLGGGGGVWL